MKVGQDEWTDRIVIVIDQWDEIHRIVGDFKFILLRCDKIFRGKFGRSMYRGKETLFLI